MSPEVKGEYTIHMYTYILRFVKYVLPFCKIFPAASTAKTNQTTGDPSLSPRLHLQYLRAPVTITVKGRQQRQLPTSTGTLLRNRVTERPPAAVLAVTTRGGQITTADRDTSREPPQFNRVPPGSYKHPFSFCVDYNHHFMGILIS